MSQKRAAGGLGKPSRSEKPSRQNPFNPPTTLNYTNADLYAFERRKIQQYNYYLRFRPEIMSHTYIEISYNHNLQDNNDIPWYRKIYFTVRSRKSFCSQATCQSHFPRGNMCDVDDKPRIFKTGDHDVESCQFGCYNLYEKAKMPPSQDDDDDDSDDDKKTKNNDKDKVDTENEEFARAPFLIYSYRQGACCQHNNGLFSMGIDSRARSDYHPVPRVTTPGTGFHYIDSGNFFERENFSIKDNQPFLDIEGNESFRFRVNKYYCDEFMLKFDGSQCYASAGEKIFGFLVSSTLYKACQYGVRYFATGVTNTDIQKVNLPPVKYKVRHQTLESWKNDVDPNAYFINPNVSLTDLGFTEDMKHCIFTTQYGYPGKLVEPLASGKNLTGNLIDYAKLNENRLYQFKYDIYTGQRLLDEYAIQGIYKYIRSNPSDMEFNEEDYLNPNDNIINLLKDLVENLHVQVAIYTANYLVTKGVEFSRQTLKLSAEYVKGVITPTLLHLVEREMLTQALHPTIVMFSRAVAKLLKLGASLIKMMDVFTTIAGIVDIFDIGFDFFNMQRIMDDGTVQQYSELDIEDIRRGYGYGTVEYSPLEFMLMCQHLKLHENWKKTPNSVLKLKCIKDYPNYKYMIPVNSAVRFDETNDNAYEWVSEYIFALQTNSNGLKINWENEMTLSQEVIDQYLHIDDHVYLKGMDEYSAYTDSFRKRVKYSQYALFVIIILFLIIIFVYLEMAAPFIMLTAIGAAYLVFSYFLK